PTSRHLPGLGYASCSTTNPVYGNFRFLQPFADFSSGPIGAIRANRTQRHHGRTRHSQSTSTIHSSQYRVWSCRSYADATSHRRRPTCTTAFGFNRTGTRVRIVITQQIKETALTSIPPYYAPQGGHPPQTDLLTDTTVVSEANTGTTKGELRDKHAITPPAS